MPLTPRGDVSAGPGDLRAGPQVHWLMKKDSREANASMLFSPRLFTAAALCWGLGTAEAVAGPFVNGDFADAPDFTGWQGQTRDTATDALVPVAPPAAPAAPWFSIVADGFARLANDAANYEVILSQAFDLPADARTLTFAYRWALTAGDPDAPDFVQALLWLADLSDFIDLFPAGVDTSAATDDGDGTEDPTATTDISRFAGGAVLLEFVLQDGDFDEQDWFEIGGIAVAAAPVPLAPTWLLLLPGLGLLLSGGVRRRTGRLPATL